MSKNASSQNRRTGVLRLFLNYSSNLLKRLDKIYRLLGSMLDTPEERLYLRLCLELLQGTNREAL